jgi:hypothetical protein
MNRFFAAACLLCLATVNLNAQEPDFAPAAHPLRDGFQKTVRVTRETIRVPGAGRMTDTPVIGFGETVVQTTARVLAFPFIGSYVVVSDGLEAIGDCLQSK